jgi:pimeloyl-ACP methyl ester carboxylesterase
MSYADVNGISLYYQEHGSGSPLILLHGGLGMGEMYAPVLPLLAKDRRVITVDLQAHGHTRTWFAAWCLSPSPAAGTGGTRRVWPGWIRWAHSSPSR